MSREFVVKKYAELLGLPADHKLCVNLEKCTHNWAIKRSLEFNDVPAYDNRHHMDRYKHKYMEMRSNLIKSPHLKNDLVSGKVKPSMVIHFSPKALNENGLYAKEVEANVAKNMKKEYNAINDPDYKGIFKCNKCRQYKTTYYEMQTRSADEPMTVFVTCHVCSITWKS